MFSDGLSLLMGSHQFLNHFILKVAALLLAKNSIQIMSLGCMTCLQLSFSEFQKFY